MADVKVERQDETQAIKAADSPSVDAFSRWRVSNPETEFDSKQIFDNQPLFWDEELESGGGISSAHSANEAATTITSTLNTAGVFTRQTFMRFNYQPGKSQAVIMTGILDDSGGGTGVQRRIGYFDDNDGLFFEDDEGTIKLVVRSNVTGSAADTKVAQSAWNIDKMDGTGPSGVTMDFSKAQIFFFDFEWLGTGRVRFGMFHNGDLHYCHEANHDNNKTSVYMSTPNLPLRYQMVTTGSSPASTMVCICSTVISEGGSHDLGVNRYASTAGTHVDCTTENTVYAIMGLRLKSAYLGETIKIIEVSIAEHIGSKHYEWFLMINPTVAGTFTYNDITNSALQLALGATANTVTNGTAVDGGYTSSAQKGGTTVSEELDTALRLGADISGNVDEIVLCVRPVGGSTAIDIEAGITWRELS